MTQAYWVNVFRSVSDAEKLAASVELAESVMTDHGGRFLARGVPAAAFEAGELERTVIIEFPSIDAGVAAYESTAYQAALEALDGGAERDIRIIAAMDGGVEG